MKTVKTSRAPQAIGPYSQGKVVDCFVFTSGQIPLTADGLLISGDFRKEAIQVLDNIKEI